MLLFEVHIICILMGIHALRLPSDSMSCFLSAAFQRPLTDSMFNFASVLVFKRDTLKTFLRLISFFRFLYSDLYFLFLESSTAVSASKNSRRQQKTAHFACCPTAGTLGFSFLLGLRLYCKQSSSRRGTVLFMTPQRADSEKGSFNKISLERREEKNGFITNQYWLNNALGA